jgi:hypothetical protein
MVGKVDGEAVATAAGVCSPGQPRRNCGALTFRNCGEELTLGTVGNG